MHGARTDERAGSRVTRLWSPVARVALLTVTLATGAVAMVILMPDRDRAIVPLGSPWLVTVALAAAFYVTERVVFHVEFRREAVTFSLSEVPLAFAIAFLPTPLAPLARIAGSVLALLAGRRPTPLKILFNAAHFSAECVLATYLVRTVLLRGSHDAGDLVVAIVPAIALASWLGGVMVSLAVASFEGRLLRHLRVEARTGWAIYVLGAVTGALSVAPMLLDRRLVLLPLAPAVFVWHVIKTRGTLSQQYRDLQQLHAFAGRVGHSLDLDRVVEAACFEVAQLLRAHHAGIVVFDERSGRAIGTGTVGDPRVLPLDLDDEAWAPLLRRAEPTSVLASSHGLLAHLLAAEGHSEALVVPVRDDQGLLAAMVLVDRDGALDQFSNDDRDRVAALVEQLAVTLRKVLLHLRMEHDATHDRLTGLPLRVVLESTLERAAGEADHLAVFMLDIDRFKEINDTLGHHAGDRVLREFAGRIGALLHEDDLLARFAGDEFSIVVRHCDPDRAGQLGRAIIDDLRRPFDLGELTIAVTCSVGYALGGADGRDPATLLRHADLAMYEAKTRSSGVERYRTGMDTDTADRMALLADLRSGIENGELEVHFQPKIDLRTETVIGAEALVRWQHPRLGLVTADRFIGLAERTDLVHRLSDVVLAQSLAAVVHWRASGYDLGVAVNYSARSLFDELLADRIAHQLERHGLPAAVLTVEVTESSVMSDIGRAAAVLERLRALGVGVSVDDYGTGHSSLAYLRRLPVTELKIDRAFVTNILIEPDDEIIARSTIDLAKHLGLSVVAEGIEATAVATRLTELGCDVGQGYGFSRPLPLAKFDAWLAVAEQRPTRLA